MLEGSCDCGAVRFTVDAPLVEVTDCNCGLCRRYAAAWSYHSPRVFRMTGTTEIYLRGDRMLEFHRCTACGCVMAWLPVDKGYDRMGINARMLPAGALEGVPVKLCDGASW